MIEKCNVCQKEHDTGEGEINEMPYKTCPEMPVDKVFFWNPKDWQREPDITPHNLAWSLDPTTSNKDD